MQVTVPDGLQGGDAMSVMVGEQEFTLTVPDGLGAGALIEVDLPIDEPAADPEPPPQEEALTEKVLVEVPAGLGPGDPFTVETAWGGAFEITVPDGIYEGDSIEVELPTQASQEPAPPEPAQPEPAQPAREPSPPPREPSPEPEPPRPLRPATCAAELPGRRVQLVKLVAKPVMNLKKGLCISYDPERERCVILVDNMAPAVAVKWENLEELPFHDVAVRSNEPPEAPPAGIYYAGDKVMVERSNGSTSHACIVEYDEVMETYVVDVGGGVLKYMVEESYITPVEYSNVRVGDHFQGRKVRIPHLKHMIALSRRVHEADLNGTIRSYDDKSKRYTVQMASGTIERNIKFSEMKVVYHLVK